MINKETNNDQLTGAFNVLIEAIKKKIDKCLPCKVLEVNDARTRVKVQPLMKVVSNNGDVVSRASISGLPVFSMGGGDTFISFPIAVGDYGWIEVSDRDISLFLQDLGDYEPPTGRKHSFSDARFIPDIMKNFTINPEDSSALVISTRDATHKIAIDQSGIRITSSSSVTINGAEITSSGDVVTASGISLNSHGHLPGTYVDGDSAPISGEAGNPT
jgi:hypothetical protein